MSGVDEAPPHVIREKAKRGSQDMLKSEIANNPFWGLQTAQRAPLKTAEYSETYQDKKGTHVPAFQKVLCLLI